MSSGRERRRLRRAARRRSGPGERDAHCGTVVLILVEEVDEEAQVDVDERPEAEKADDDDEVEEQEDAEEEGERQGGTSRRMHRFVLVLKLLQLRLLPCTLARRPVRVDCCVPLDSRAVRLVAVAVEL